MLFVGAPLTR